MRFKYLLQNKYELVNNLSEVEVAPKLQQRLEKLNKAFENF
jgi:hypothetical protein